MSALSWKNDADGNWNTAGNWSNGAVPGAADDVTVNTPSAHVITYNSGKDSIGSLYFGTNDTLAFSAGTLSVLGNTTFYGTLTQSGGAFVLGGATSNIVGRISQTAGALNVVSGTLSLSGTANSFAGTLSGTTVNFTGGSDSIAAGAVVNMQQIQLSGAALTLGESLTQSGTWLQSAGTLTLGGNTLTVGGAATFDGGIVTGSGTLALGGKTEIAGSFALEGQATMINTGTVSQVGYFYLGYNGPDTPQFQNKAGATYRLGNDSSMSASAGGTFANAGTLIKTGTGGISSITANVASTGTITVAGGTLRLYNGNNSFSGLLNGGGTLDLYGGADTLNAGLTLSVGSLLLEGANVNLASSNTYAGAFTQTSGTLALGGNTLTLSNAALDGGYASGTGSLALTGTTDVSGYALAGGVVLSNTGVLTQSGTFYIGYAGSDTAKLVNAANATWKLNGASVVYGQTGDLITNAGLLTKATGSGASNIYVSTNNTGTISVASGILRFNGSGSDSFGGTVSGSGTLALDATATAFAKGLSLTVAHTSLENGVLTLKAKLAYAGSWAQTSGTLALGGQVLTLSGNAALDNGTASGSGTLVVKSAEVNNYFMTGSTVLQNGGTITQNGALYVGYYSGDTAKLNNAVKTSLLIQDNNSISGATGGTIVNAGTIAKVSGSGISQIGVSTASTGTITAASGTLRFAGATNSFAGVLGGAGTLEFNTGADSFATGLSVTASNLLLDGATVTLAGPLSYAGNFNLTGGTLALGSNALTLSGLSNFEGGYVTGAGTLALAGGSWSGGAFSGSSVIKTSGMIDVVGSIYVGYYSSDTAQLQIQAGSTLRLENGSVLYGSTGSSISNAGNLVKAGAPSSYISDSFSTTGTVTVASGTLTLQGATNVIGGLVNGAGYLQLNTGTDNFSAGTSLTVGGVVLSGATVSVANALNYGGLWSQTGGTLALSGVPLTLSGQASFTGGAITGSGTISLTGASALSGVAFEGSTTVSNAGTMSIVNYFYDGYNSGDTVQFINNAKGTMQLQGGAYIYGTAGSTLSNAGSIVKSGSALSQINVAVINSGTMELTQGGMTFAAAVSGSGTITEDAGTRLAFTGAVAAGGIVAMAANTDLYLNSTAGFADTIQGFALGDVIEVGGLGYGTTNSFSFDSAHDQLTVSNGSSTTTLQLSGSYNAGSFHLFNDAGIVGITHT